jgi:alginate O-acetyltransferase complex protein AlgI
MPVIGLTRNPYLAVIATFMVMGAWHAAIPPNWIVWGLWHGLGIVAALSWTRFAQKRRIKVFKTRLGAGLGWALTIGFVALGGAFTALHGLAPLTDSFRLIAAAFGLRF